MRFLQTEWHRHERDRNAWEIERAEMKSRIGRLEGDARTSRRMHESLGKHVKILEAALKREREKVKSLAAGEKIDVARDPKDIAKENLKALSKRRPPSVSFSVWMQHSRWLVEQQQPQNLRFDTDPADDPTHPDFRQDTERDKSRVYLGKCSQEVAYHI